MAIPPPKYLTGDISVVGQTIKIGEKADRFLLPFGLDVDVLVAGLINYILGSVDKVV